jgi:hypothetical protein
MAANLDGPLPGNFNRHVNWPLLRPDDPGIVIVELIHDSRNYQTLANGRRTR